jgi:FMN-dependent NADH-azoreductase
MEAKEPLVKGHLPRPGWRSDQSSQRRASSGGVYRPKSAHPEIRRELTVGANAMAEFLAADVIVIGAPMYNFGIPSQLKAWIDRLAVAGKTFAYTPQGPKGLVGGKTIIVASSRGGYYGAGTPLAAIDHQENYLRSTFGFLGITDIRFVRAEGVNVSPETKQQAIAAAEQEALKAAA